MKPGSKPVRILVFLTLVLGVIASLPSASGASTVYFPSGFESDHSFDGIDQNVQWKTAQSTRWMDWGDTESAGNSIVGEYEVEVAEFQVDPVKRDVQGVLVKVYDAETGEEVATGFYRNETRYVIYRDDIRVGIFDLRDAEAGDDGTKFEREEVRAQAKVSIELRATPDPEVTSIEFSEEEDFDKKVDEIFSATEFWTRVKFKNSGKAKMFDTQFSVDVPDYEVLDVRDSSGRLSDSEYTVEDGTVAVDYAGVKDSWGDTPPGTLNKSQTYTLKLKLEAPRALQERDIPVSADVEGVDIKGRSYGDSSSKDMTVFSVVHVYKSISPDTNPDTDQFEMYLGQEFTVTLRVRNFADTPVTVNTLTDSVPPTFALLANQSTEWRDLEVAPQSVKVLTYRVVPQKTGSTEIPKPSGNFTWKTPGVISSANAENKVVIGSGTTHGPLITVTKRVTPSGINVGDVGNVTIEIKNEGDRSAFVRLQDEEPEGLLLLDSLPTESGVLQEGEVMEAGYRFKAPSEGNYTLPAATVVYEDVVGTRFTVKSTEPGVVVGEPAEEEPTGSGDVDGEPSGEEAPTPTETPVVPGPGAAAILLIICVSALTRR